VLLSERGLGGNDADLELRLRRWRGDKGPRAEAARGLARRWRKLCVPAHVGTQSGLLPSQEHKIAQCIALAFPDRVAKRRDAGGADWISVGGRGFRLDPADPLARNLWLAVADVSGAAGGARILAAAPIDQPTVEGLFVARIETGTRVAFDPSTGGVRASHDRRLGAITLSGGQDSRADPAAIATALLEGVRAHGLGLLPWSEAASALRVRTDFARRVDSSLADLSDAAMLADLDDWLPPLLEGKRRLGEVDAGALAGALETRLGWTGRQAVERNAPREFETLAGSRHPIDYAAEAGPTVTVRVQALFGLAEHPLAGGEPLILSLTSPAGRPIQTTRDLPGFWAGSWAAVAKEMRGRYPKHPWPDDPAAAPPTLRTKRADKAR
jgi:ATP-dependent helicase HrpB